MEEKQQIPNPYNSGFLRASDLHNIYFEQSGNPQGIPLLRIHGGPGGNSKPKHRTYFDNQKFNIILFDQRGCGQSTPQGELQQNTTQELIEDIEKLRQHLQIEKWVVVGPSWGSTLALLYSQQYPHHVSQLIVQGVFTGRQREIEWILGGGAERLFPDHYQKLISIIQPNIQTSLATQIYEKLLHEDLDTQKKVARAVSRWEYTLSSLETPSAEPTEITIEEINAMKIQYHYMANNCFLADNEILNNAHKLANTPLTIIQGRYDIVCPFETAWELYEKCCHAQLHICTAGHYGNETPLLNALHTTLNELTS